MNTEQLDLKIWSRKVLVSKLCHFSSSIWIRVWHLCHNLFNQLWVQQRRKNRLEQTIDVLWTRVLSLVVINEHHDLYIQMFSFRSNNTTGTREWKGPSHSWWILAHRTSDIADTSNDNWSNFKTVSFQHNFSTSEFYLSSLKCPARFTSWSQFLTKTNRHTNALFMLRVYVKNEYQILN